MRVPWQALSLRQRQYLARSTVIGALLVFPFVDLVWNLQLLNAVTDAAVFVVLALGLNIVVGSEMLARADLSLWRWFFFGLTLIIVMVLRPEGLWPSAQRAAELHASEETA